MLRYLSGGESHGPALTGIIEGLPAGLRITSDYINKHLSRRQQGYGRGGRMKIEADQVKFLSGIRFNRTMGSPLTLMVENKDSVNWSQVMSPEGEKDQQVEAVNLPRPGHVDFAGSLKYRTRDIRDVLERASARETAMRVAVGSVARRLLEELGIEVFSHVVAIGGVEARLQGVPLRVLKEKRDNSSLFCGDSEAEARMREAIDAAWRGEDTLGGVFEILVSGVPPGLGSHVHWDRKLDGRLAGALMSLQGIKGVETGLGFASAFRRGSQVHDPFYYSAEKGIYRNTNYAGGVEGGISNGQMLVLRAAMKPIPTLLDPLASVDLETREEKKATVERSDVCAVPAASVVGEAIAAWELSSALLEKFSGDSMEEIKSSFREYMEWIKERLDQA